MLKLDKQLPVEQFEATASQSTAPSPPLCGATRALAQHTRAARACKSANMVSANMVSILPISRIELLKTGRMLETAAPQPKVNHDLETVVSANVVSVALSLPFLS